MSVRRFKLRAKRALRHMAPSHVVWTRVTKRTIMRFAEKVGLMYFGYVDQRNDDHRLIRGHTVSATHQDNHYCIGSFKGYDVMMVLRNDVVEVSHAQKREQRCHWLILTIDLHTRYDVPHCYIGHHDRDHAFRAYFEPLSPLALGSLHTYSHRFLSDYSVYAKATHAIEIERIISPDVSAVIAEYFASASIEIEDGTLYLYIESQRPTEALLEKMLSNGVWLAESIDMTYASLAISRED